MKAQTENKDTCKWFLYGKLENQDYLLNGGCFDEFVLSETIPSGLCPKCNQLIEVLK